MDDPYRLYLVVRRGAFEDLETGGVLAGAAAVACLERFGADPAHAEAVAAWRARPGKVTLRARGGQWPQVLDLPHALAGDPDGAAVAALPPRRRSERGELLERLQAMSSELEPAPVLGDGEPPAAADGRLTYLVNPALEMSSGKTLAQIAHAATMAAARPDLAGWVAAGCPARVRVPAPVVFAALCGAGGLAAEVQDAGLTEVAPGTVTVLAVAPALRPC
ncbi:peptidyl-tRNA hydrolase [Baekduia soli]|uniref:Peptidyl-tRNA hydrolase n=1 Tax=Baekduia soli TaxID=496014 RepID=A0A5B8U9L5_9ACTN|nr:peptidyl-tRNA hydrolase [Baekduia soli]QEC49873.1 peptidyl-tRNA hydrolase [Baekduia soli]